MASPKIFVFGPGETIGRVERAIDDSTMEVSVWQATLCGAVEETDAPMEGWSTSEVSPAPIVAIGSGYMWAEDASAYPTQPIRTEATLRDGFIVEDDDAEAAMPSHPPVPGWDSWQPEDEGGKRYKAMIEAIEQNVRANHSERSFERGH